MQDLGPFPAIAAGDDAVLSEYGEGGLAVGPFGHHLEDGLEPLRRSDQFARVDLSTGVLGGAFFPPPALGRLYLDTPKQIFELSGLPHVDSGFDLGRDIDAVRDGP